jgi:superfamily I DNA/RNA helicase
MLSRSVISKLASTGKYKGWSPEQTLQTAANERTQGLNGWQVERILELEAILSELSEQVSQAVMLAGDLLDWMIQRLNYLDYFQDYYGRGEHADEKKFAVLNFIRFVSWLHLSPAALLEHLASLDTTQGKPEAEQIVFTSIFRTKGLEYDYVLIPQCDENLLPYLRGERTDIYDIAGIVRESVMSSALESERRLFYVALTRARKGVFIGASAQPSRFLEEMQVKETENVMNAVTWLASGESNAAQALQQSLQSGGMRPNLLTNLIYGYLPDLGQMQLIEQLQCEWTLAVPATGVETQKVYPF